MVQSDLLFRKAAEMFHFIPTVLTCSLLQFMARRRRFLTVNNDGLIVAQF